MPRRVGAWLLDGLLIGLLSLVPLILALVSGAVAFNQEALDQIQASTSDQPFATVTAPIVNVSMGPLVVVLAIYVLIHAAYFAGSWIMAGATPAQRGLGLRIVDNASGNRLSIDQALLRWLLLDGISTIVGSVVVVIFLNAAATTPLNQLFGIDAAGRSSMTSGSFGGVTVWSNLISWGSSLWTIALLISAGTNSLHRGLHDRLVGSIVLGTAPMYPSWPGYAYPPQTAPYWPPQAGPGFSGSSAPWPGYPPQPGYPPAPAPGPYSPVPPYAGQAPVPGAAPDNEVDPGNPGAR
jgi:uncharacterized RDD family membrane protein YckC